MKWVKDKTGRFPRRPHYLPGELDSECETVISDFLHRRHGRLSYPVSTDDLTVLIETLVDDLDLYSDLSAEPADVEGVTDFFPGRRPKIRISKRLTTDARMTNRLRTTLTHELGHVKFHTFMFDGPTSGFLFGSSSCQLSNKCNRDDMRETRQSNWIEWQAGFACGAFLMPHRDLAQTVRHFVEDLGTPLGKFELTSANAQSLITVVTEQFEVSRDAARVRLLQKGILVDSVVPAALFS